MRHAAIRTLGRPYHRRDLRAFRRDVTAQSVHALLWEAEGDVRAVGLCGAPLYGEGARSCTGVAEAEAAGRE